MLTIEALQELGVNTKEGLNRCLNNEQFYFRLIKKALDGNDVEKLRSAVEAGDLDTAFAIAHNLKGAMGNLSLTPIYESAAELTELLRSRTQTDYMPYINTITENRDALRALYSD
jgi:HPt (histidine-containing phosphotransfer) domain-containing protein